MNRSPCRSSVLRILLSLLAFAVIAIPSAAWAQTIHIPPGAVATDQGLDRVVPALARLLLADPPAEPAGATHLDRVRLALAAGAPDQALGQLVALGGDPASPPLADHPERAVLEIVARARAGAEAGPPSEAAHVEAFRHVLAPLTDLEAYEVVWYLETPHFVFSGGLERAVEAVPEGGEVPVAAALALIRAHLAQRAHADLLPYLAGLVAAEEARRYEFDDEILIQTPEGATLSAVMVRSRSLPGPVPTTLTYTIYADPSSQWSAAKLAAAHGYAGVTAFARGKHRSPDPVLPYETEVDDTHAVIDWISRQPWSDGRVAMIGGSYDGFAAWAATKRMHPALRTIVVTAAAIPGQGLPMMNNVFLNANYGWGFFVGNGPYLDHEVYGDRERWMRLPQGWFESGRPYREIDAVDGTPNPFLQRWLDHPAYDDYWQSMVPFGEDFAGIDIPVLTITGYYDDGQVSALHYMREHLAHNPDAPHFLVIGPYDHGSVGAPRKPRVMRGYATDPVAQFSSPGLTFEWLDHVFHGRPRPEFLADRVNFQLMGANEWVSAPSLSELGSEKIRLYLGDGRLTPSPASAGEGTGWPGFAEQVVDLGDRSSERDNYYPDPILQDSAVFRTGVVYRSDPFPDGLTVAGQFEGVLRATVNKRDLDLSLTLYEEFPDGSLLHLSYFLGRASYAPDMTARTLLSSGEPVEIPFTRSYMTGRHLEPGSRLLLRLDVVKDPWHQVNHGTGGEVSSETAADAGEPLRVRWHGDSYAEIPIRRRSPAPPGQIAPGGTHELRQTLRDDGSAIHWVLDRRGSLEPQGVLVMVQGSGCASVLDNRSLEQARTLASDRAVVMIERYGVLPGHAPNDSMADCPPAFLENHTVSRSASDLIKVMAELRETDWWSGELALFGGSEGGAVVALAAPAIPETDAVIVLSSGLGMTFAEIILAVAPPHVETEVTGRLDEIRANPESTTLWGGHTYRWLADVLDRRYVADLLAVDAPILIIQGSHDTQVPTAASAAVHEAFESAGRSNLAYWEYEGYDHGMSDEMGVSRLPEVLTRAAGWLVEVTRVIDHRIIGFLEIPQLFGGWTPDWEEVPREPGFQLLLRRAPSSEAPAVARIDSPERMERGEFAYEVVGASVFGRSGGWNLLRTIDGKMGWAEPREEWTFHSLEHLLLEGLTYLTPDFDGVLYRRPGGGGTIEIPGDPTRRTIGSWEASRPASPLLISGGPEIQDGLPVFDIRPDRFQMTQRWFNVQETARAGLRDDPDRAIHPETDPTDSEAHVERAFGPRSASVRVLEVQRVGEDLWARVKVHSESPCLGLEEPEVIAEGWLPLHAPSGAPNVWFYPRGC